jgi:hypothetical protein
MDNWETIEAEIERIISAEKQRPFTPETIAQARDFLQAVRDRCPVPNVVCKGYWSTIIFSWSRRLDIEIYGGHVETYRFYPGRTDIRHFAHTPGEPFPPELIAELPMLGSQE